MTLHPSRESVRTSLRIEIAPDGYPHHFYECSCVGFRFVDLAGQPSQEPCHLCNGARELLDEACGCVECAPIIEAAERGICDRCLVVLGENDCCPSCGVHHGDNCPGCGNRGYHRATCSIEEGAGRSESCEVSP